jgi:hypothetical protein
MQNSNEQMRREFEEFCKNVHRLHGPFLRDCNDPEPEREYQLFETQNLWERWQAAHTSAAEKYKGVVEAARDVCASASYMKQMTERGEVYGSPDMAVPIASMESLRQALAAIEQQQEQNNAKPEKQVPLVRMTAEALEGDESVSDIGVGGASQVVSSGDVRVVATAFPSNDESGASQTSPTKPPAPQAEGK